MEKQIFESAYATVNGLKMYYEVHGSGDIPLVLIHGGGSTIWTTFGRILPLFAKNRKVIGVELQAHGHSGDRDTDVTFEQDADDVAALLAHLGINKADFLGFSNGGSTALQIGIRHPDVVRKLIVVSAIYKRSGLFSGFFDMMETASLENMPQPLQAEYLRVAPDKTKLQVMHDKDRDRMIHFKDWPESDLRTITMPTLIMNADRDVVLPEHAIEMARLIPHAELIILPGTHGAFLGEICTVEEGSRMPALVADMLDEWLEK
ncbi:Putative aminoacrylate hydrolase RutD [Dyadobacter sp. CECT 9275]|uniref:Aminoacrylate hydrolase RutD n=1 Tax=Dyadobacter helix TaxID=2822344 RepID=A0A916JDD8_9BACT|nr:alpha/beta hydrolase [Dyadobacter sp. CECT 9275]CAG5003287.1 Putative aminoacrylate hydrolase RutD [Dyadobacter sp. CECT 9275]